MADMDELKERLNKHDDRLRDVETGLSSLRRLPDAIDHLTEKIDEISGVSHEVKSIEKDIREDRKKIDDLESEQVDILAQINQWKTPMKILISIITAASLGAFGLEGYQQISEDNNQPAESVQETIHEDK